MERPRLVIIAPLVGDKFGGEALKVQHFYSEMSKRYANVVLLTHARCRKHLENIFPGHEILYVEDSLRFLNTLWRSPIYPLLMDVHFHLAVRSMVRRWPDGNEGTVLHYLCPISPILPRFAPASFHKVIGPLNGNLDYPPAFLHRRDRSRKILNGLYRPLQTLSRFVLRDKARFDRVLVSGQERTRAALRWAGVAETAMSNVEDSGLADGLQHVPQIEHKATSGSFVCSGRLVDYKAFDLAIRALAQCEARITLDIFGDGDRAKAWRALASDLGVSDRVRFMGWTAQETMLRQMSGYRGFIFPSLAEANGIVLQEAMMLGLPVVALRWGGPVGLMDDTAAKLIEPKSEAHVIRELAAAMTQLADDPELANDLASRARHIAETRFPWPKVINDWTESYKHMLVPVTHNGM